MSAPSRADRWRARGALARETGATLALATPLILANLAVTLMTTTDYVMLGRLSPQALAAGALGFNLYQPAFLLGIGVVAAVSPIAAAKLGAGDALDGVRRSTHQALLTALVIAAVAWAFLSQTTAILTAIGEPPELAREAGRYMWAFQWGLAPSLMFFAGRSVFAAFERPREPLLAGLVAVGFNALANYALIFGKFGLPALGIAGSGLATTLSQTLMLILLVGFSLIDPRMRRLALFSPPWRFARDEFVALWRLGLPIGATIAAEVGVFAAATLAMGLIGPATLEAHTIALQIASLAFMVPLGLGQAATVRIGRAYGARDRSAIAHAGAAAFGLTLVFAVLSAATMIAIPKLLISGFLAVDAPANAATVRIAVSLLWIAAIFQVADASQATLANMLRGLHDSRWPLVIALLGYWGLGAPIGVALGFATPLGGVGVWIGLAAGLAAVALLLGARWLRKARGGFVADRPDQGAMNAVIGEAGSERPAITS
ncbi:MATE family multidrug resistance protein [Roseiarcus fermentans]|uniref:MATE family multidrug resistance protein n=1 Tax=Roseiarcus fermentans TaxID=1473586 RepID=A0A366EP53_9HYPH|nr:MATE family efflux transporter [Roseiarcus fermentans]RBP04171.1 MATE family multidrug resistance protein [Roseiarcus fermentans]